MSVSESDDLSAKLRTWKVEPRVPGSFPREVWQRIAARQSAREEAFWPRVLEWFSTQLVRPQYAVALVVVSLSVSLGVAHVQAQETKVKHWKALEDRYAASVDPLAMMR
jgi:hypothetical protein